MTRHQTEKKSESNIQSDEISITPFNPFEEAFHDTRYTLYNKYRFEDPIHWGINAVPRKQGSWYVFRYDDIITILRDTQFGRKPPNTNASKIKSNVSNEHTTLWELTTQWMLLTDPPKHTEYRKIFQRGFAEHFQSDLSSRIAKIAQELVSKLTDCKTFDLISEVAIPLPIRVISELMGIPSQNHSDVRRWSQEIFLAVDLKNNTAKYKNAAVAAQETSELFHDLISYKRRSPKDDIISTIVNSEEGRKLSDVELVANFSFFLFAASETTVALIGNSILTLLQNPSQWHLLCKNNTLVESTINEVLRYESPVQATTRFALTDITLAGKNIHKGDHLCIMFGAGNRDPLQFTNPDQFDITRTPNRHFGFGFGSHFCIGSALGMMEGQIALQTLLREIPDMQLQIDTPEWHNSVSIRSLQQLPISRN